jgi:hypothetical protein
MTPQEAREALSFHSGAHPDTDDPRWQSGFLGSLRPFKGLREENFHDVMCCLRVLGHSLQDRVVERETVAAVWGICHLGRSWGVHPEGMLRRNGLISQEDVDTLETWIDTISYAFLCLLDDDEQEAFAGYQDDDPVKGSGSSGAG